MEQARSGLRLVTHGLWLSQDTPIRRLSSWKRKRHRWELDPGKPSIAAKVPSEQVPDECSGQVNG